MGRPQWELPRFRTTARQDACRDIAQDDTPGGADFGVRGLQVRVGRSVLGDFVPGEHQVQTEVENLATRVLQ